MRATGALLLSILSAACGDNFAAPLDGPPIEPADVLFVIAHFDDDMIFMQPELVHAIGNRAVTTIYVTSGDPVYGLQRTDRNFEAARIAYSSVAEASDWDCGYLLVGGSPVHHCRLHERNVSLIALDIPDGGIEGDYSVSPLHLVEHKVTSVPIMGWAHGTATTDSILESLTALIEATHPAEIHALDLAATHGRDHSSHLFSSSFALWSVARLGYPGIIRWHRGYNVGDDATTLPEVDYQSAKRMLGYFEACYFGCGPCGTSCPTLNMAHDIWLQRQYASTRAPLDTRGTLALEGDPAQCLSATPAGFVLADCAGATPVELDAGGHLRVEGGCVASAAASDALVLAPCSDTPEQYWVSDSDGHMWNGSPPRPAPDMAYDHVRCLAAEPVPGAVPTASICGSRLSPAWKLGPG